MDFSALKHLITVDPDVVSGTPVFRGTRVPLKALFDHLEYDEFEEFLIDFPSVSREHAKAVIHALAEKVLLELKSEETAAGRMKILLDEGVPLRFRKDFPPHHDVYTVRYMGWTSIKNGALLKLIAEHGFDCWITADQSIPYQQNVGRFPCLVVVMETPGLQLKRFQAMLPQLLPVLDAPPEHKLVVLTRK